jgi:NAD(P)H-hydrate epimerase
VLALLVKKSLVASWLPRRGPADHKHSGGHTLIIAGSPGMHGAAYFAAAAAFAAGAGVVTLAAPRSLYALLGALLPEALFVFTDEADIDVPRYSAVAIGPGRPPRPELPRLAAASGLPQVWDAGALGSGAVPPKGCVITPHPGEMARLAGISVKDVQRARAETAGAYADKHGVVTVLKGSPTVVAVPGGEMYINTTGSAAMATAGMGDALAGIIAALLARGLPPEKAAVCAVFWHGLAGERLTEGMTVRELITRLPAARADILCEGE